MDEQARVKQMEVRQPRGWIQPPIPKTTAPESSAELTVLPAKPSGWKTLWQPERLTRNLAAVGCLALVLIAAQRMLQEPDVSVFSALKSEMTAEWDEDIGKLSFVSELLPPEIRAVWNPSAGVNILQPVMGEVVHAWSQSEPYLEFASNVTDVRAVSQGEVMSIAHGLGEERIIRIRHTDGSESLYGNLETTYVECGTAVDAGDIIGSLIKHKPLAFELRIDGRSIDPVPCMAELSE